MAEEGILACAEAGLAGFVGTDGTVEELVTAIERAMRGELLCPPRIVARLFDRVAELARDYGPADAAEPVIDAARAADRAAHQGRLSNKEIAAELRIGPATVKKMCTTSWKSSRCSAAARLPPGCGKGAGVLGGHPSRCTAAETLQPASPN